MGKDIAKPLVWMEPVPVRVVTFGATRAFGDVESKTTHYLVHTPTVKFEFTRRVDAVLTVIIERAVEAGAARGAVTGAIGRLLVKTGGRMPGARKIEEAVAKVLEDQKSPRNTAALCAEVARKYDSKAMVRVSRDTVAEFDPRKPGGDTEDTSKYTVTVTDLTGRMLLSTDGPTAAVVLNRVNSTTPTKPIALTK